MVDTEELIKNIKKSRPGIRVSTPTVEENPIEPSIVYIFTYDQITNRYVLQDSRGRTEYLTEEMLKKALNDLDWKIFKWEEAKEDSI